MGNTVFIAGSMKIKHLDPLVKERLDKIISGSLQVVMGDAEGADTSIQTYLQEGGATNATVYCSGSKPRNNVGNWPVKAIASTHEPGTRAFFTVKDVAMADAADYGLMIWDAKSTGTLSNVIELLKRNKKSVVFVNKDKKFVNVGGPAQLAHLLDCMSLHARQKAEEKLRVTQQIESLKHTQLSMFGDREQQAV